VKARKVKGLDPDGALVDNMRRVILVRLGELYGFADAARDPANVEELHDMRIAAKRLRYLLELSDPLFGREAKRAAKAAKSLQDVLGDIHDCDELIEVANERCLDSLAAYTRGRRAGLHNAFVHEWSALEDDGLREALEAELRADRTREEG
jgi:CHAD domain-containing protein